MSVVLPITPSPLCASVIMRNSIKGSENVLTGKTEKELVESGVPQEVIDKWKKLNS